jgi:ankyrin repeat protein
MARSMKKKVVETRINKEEEEEEDIPMTKEEAVRKRLEKIDKILMNPNDDSFAALSSSIHRAAGTGRIDAVRTFVMAKRVPSTQQDFSGVCPIHYAAEKGFVNIIQFLIENGCHVDQRTRSGVTPLMYAAKGNQLEIMQWLWNQGAQVTAHDVGGMTTAHYAAQNDSASALELLYTLHIEDLVKKAGIADALAQSGERIKIVEEPKPDNIVLDTPSLNGTTPLHVASIFDAKNAVDVLLKYQVNINATDSTGETPLHKAGRKNYTIMYRHLVRMGASETMRNMTKETPLDLLRDVSHT